MWLPTWAYLDTRLLLHFQYHGAPVTMDSSMAPGSLHDALRYVCHSSATWYTAFVITELEVQNAMGNIIVVPWEDIRKLLGLYISPIGLIPKKSCRS